MSDEQAPATPEPAPPAATSDAAATTATAPADWSTALDTLPVEEIRKHRRFAGILGSEMATQRTNWERDQKATQQRQAAEEAERQMLAQAQSDPVGFAEKWLQGKQGELTARELEGMRGGLRQDFARRLGESFRGLPEWAEMTQDEHAKLLTAVQGKADDDVLTAFTAAAADLVAERRAKGRFEKWKSTELDREREALRTEEAAKLLAKTPGADISRSKRGSDSVDVDAMSDKEFDKYWRNRFSG